MKRKGQRLSIVKIIAMSFLVIIALGTILLMLPFSSRIDGCAPFLDCLFTSVSATCVTGLIVQDTYTYWTGFGQAVILTMIQIGGMGVVTITIAIATLSSGRVGLLERTVMSESISASGMGDMTKLTSFILKTSLTIEAIGAFLMMPVFIPKYGLTGLWMSFFHSISAFCNAGFDLMGIEEKYSSLTSMYDNAYLTSVVMILIVVGGIGFLVWDDIKHKGFKFKRYKMQTKTVLIVSALLLFIPAIYLFMTEYAYEPLGDRILLSMFQSVTTRTAGFNTADFSAMMKQSQFFMIILMLIGGSPGSTAGGMKTTTVAVVIAATISTIKNKKDVEMFGRRIPDITVRTALTIIVLYATLFMSFGGIISAIEGIPLMTCFFETASAVGTVGISFGITPYVGSISRILIMILMFCGRVGGLSFIYAAIGKKEPLSRLPLEDITVG